MSKNDKVFFEVYMEGSVERALPPTGITNSMKLNADDFITQLKFETALMKLESPKNKLDKPCPKRTLFMGPKKNMGTVPVPQAQLYTIKKRITVKYFDTKN